MTKMTAPIRLGPMLRCSKLNTSSGIIAQLVFHKKSLPLGVLTMFKIGKIRQDSLIKTLLIKTLLIKTLLIKTLLIKALLIKTLLIKT